MQIIFYTTIKQNLVFIMQWHFSYAHHNIPYHRKATVRTVRELKTRVCHHSTLYAHTQKWEQGCRLKYFPSGPSVSQAKESSYWRWVT